MPAKTYEPDSILKPDEVAEWLQVSRRTLQRLRIPAVAVGHRTIRYVAKDVIQYLSRLSK